MKPSDSDRLWSGTDTPMSDDYRRLSYALFRVDGDIGRIVAARSPDRRVLSVGAYIQDRLDLCEEALAYMGLPYYELPPLFVRNQKGIGLLLSRYHLPAGLGLYLHIHADPASVARLIHCAAIGQEFTHYTVSKRLKSMGGPLTPRDEAIYPILADAWFPVRDLVQHTLFRVNQYNELTLGELRDKAKKLAAFVGCDLTFTVRKAKGSAPPSPYTKVKCYRPLLLEALLLYLFSEIRERSATRGGVCCLEDPVQRERDGLVLTLRYPLCPEEDPETAYFTNAFHSHLSNTAELGGMDVYFPAEHPASRTEEGLREQVVMLDQILDPALLSTSDLKAALRFPRTQTEHPPLLSEEIPFPDPKNL